MERKKAKENSVIGKISDGKELASSSDPVVEKVREETTWELEMTAEAKNGKDALYDLARQYLIEGDTRKAVYFFKAAMMEKDHRAEFYYGLLTLGATEKKFYEGMDLMVRAVLEVTDATYLATLRNILQKRFLNCLAELGEDKAYRLSKSCDYSVEGLRRVMEDYLYNEGTKRKKINSVRLTMVLSEVMGHDYFNNNR